MAEVQQAPAAAAAPAPGPIVIDTQHDDMVHDSQLDYYGTKLATASSGTFPSLHLLRVCVICFVCPRCCVVPVVVWSVPVRCLGRIPDARGPSGEPPLEPMLSFLSFVAIGGI